MVHKDMHRSDGRKMIKELGSVILPVSKAVPDFLEQSVQSILFQTHDEIELVVVFDEYNSNVDDSAFAVLEKLRDDHRLQLIVNNRRLGLPSSLNEGIKLSKGECIARMD
jgi:glycosyltransferase involved in cell wall biosynthesis